MCVHTCAGLAAAAEQQEQPQVGWYTCEACVERLHPFVYAASLAACCCIIMATSGMLEGMRALHPSPSHTCIGLNAAMPCSSSKLAGSMPSAAGPHAPGIAIVTASSCSSSGKRAAALAATMASPLAVMAPLALSGAPAARSASPPTSTAASSCSTSS